jgi:hypothetical protein
MTVPKRFGILRFFGTFVKVIAWIFLVLSVLGAIGAVLVGSASFFTNLAADTLPLGDLPLAGVGALGIAGGFGILLGGLLNFLIFYVVGESIHMQLAVEENTRLTAALLLRMHQESRVQEEQAAYGDSGFVTEAYE